MWSAGNWDEEGTLTLCRRTGDTWAVVKEVRLETARSLQGARLSRSGRLLAAAGPGNVVRVYTVPDLRERGQVRFPVSGASNLTVEGLDFSPDEGMLAVGTHAALPGLVRIPEDPEEPMAKTSRGSVTGTTSLIGPIHRRRRPRAHARPRPDGVPLERQDAGSREAVRPARRIRGGGRRDVRVPWILCAPEDWPGGTEPKAGPSRSSRRRAASSCSTRACPRGSIPPSETDARRHAPARPCQTPADLPLRPRPRRHPEHRRHDGCGGATDESSRRRLSLRIPPDREGDGQWRDSRRWTCAPARS